MKSKTKQLLVSAIIIMGSILMVPNTYSRSRQAEVNISRISELKRYTVSYIQGEVVRIIDEDEFRLEDQSGRIKVYTGWKNTFVVEKGEKVTVKGRLDPGIIKEFYATEIIRENGEVINLDLDD